MIDKRSANVAEALRNIQDGSTIFIGGFGTVGQPNSLIRGLIAQGSRDLTVIANNAGFGEVGMPELIGAGHVRKMICSYPRGSQIFEDLYAAGKIELEIVPQGTLAERIRAGGAGVPAFFTPTTVGTILAEGKEHRDFGGRTYVLETALTADFALVEGYEGDRWGNLTYSGSGANFNPIMAMAAKTTIAQVTYMRELGEIRAIDVRTPGIYVNHIVALPDESSVKNSVIKRVAL